MSRVLPLTPEREADFAAIHAGEEGWCQCVAWWVETWEGWGDRSREANAALRVELFGRGEHDGYLLYEGARPVAWCQVGPRDRLVKLCRQYALEPDPAAYAITCLQVAPDARRRGHARALVEGVLADLASRGVARVEAFPKRGEGLESHDLWTGPEALYAALGFVLSRDDPARPVYVKELRGPA